MRDKHTISDVLPLSQIRQMEVIDISDGKRLGFISDIIFDNDLRKIDYLVVPPQGNIFSLFKKRDETLIRWDQIKIIGIDIILVDISPKNANDVQFINS